MAVVKTYSDLIGYAGTGLILLLYLLLAGGVIAVSTYFGLSLISSLLMLAHGYERQSRPIILLNAAWFLISAVGLIRPLL